MRGIQSGRYQFALGDLSVISLHVRRKNDFVREFVVFAVKSGNP
ncbi:MAG: hypothetical protein ACSLEN_01075 [Candidatus Malihini olakiniferum]